VISLTFLRLGGADTTAIALTFGLYYIVSIPKVWSRLSQEVRSSFERSEDITVSSTQQLQFLNAVIQEGIFVSLQI
jgi:cytochrome P450